MISEERTLVADELIIDLRDDRVATFSWPTVTVVIPTINEAKNLPYVLPLIPLWVDEVIVVDSSSTDGTVDVVRALMPKAVIVDEPRRGKGQAMRTGFSMATGDLIVALDADGSTDPREIPAFIGALHAGSDVAKGTRFVHGGGTEDMERHRKFGNWCLTTAVNKLFGGNYSDLCYGYFAFRRSVLSVLVPSEEEVLGFEIETLINIRALRAGLHVREVPSFEHPRRFGTSNLRVVRDGIRIAKVIVAEARSKQINT